MILNETDLINLITDTYKNAIVEHDRFGNLRVYKDKSIWCVFYFKTFQKNVNDDKFACVHEDFVGHTCLSFGWSTYDSGGGYMTVADQHDLAPEIIKYIDNHIRPQKKTYEQLTLF